MTGPCRAAFEDHANSRNMELRRSEDGYAMFETQLAWHYWQASRKVALEDAHAICEGCETAFNAIASSDLVTPQGRTVHASMAMGAKNCANEIKELLK